MMSLNLNLKEFLKYLLRFKWLLLIIPIVCATVTYFLAKKLPRTYTSSALISTGIKNQFQQSAMGGQGDGPSLTQQFGNITQMMKSRKNLTSLSYKLILHDLKDPENAFKKPTKLVAALSPQDRQFVIGEYEKRLAAGSLISVNDNGSRIKLYDILSSYGYNDGSLGNNISIARNEGTDFINITYSSTNPELSAYVVNTFSRDFIAYYTGLLVSSQRETLDILDSVLKKKQIDMEQKGAAAQSAISGAASQAAGAADIQRKEEMTYSRSVEAEGQRQSYVRQISSLKGALADIDTKLRGQGGYLSTETSPDNSALIDIDAKLRVASQKYYNNNFKAADKASMDSLQRIKDRLVARVSGTGTVNQTALKQDLLAQKLKLEGDLAAAQSALTTIEQQIASMPKTSGGSVAVGSGPSQSVIHEAEIAAADYQNTLNQYNQTKLMAGTSATLSLAEPGLPGVAEKSKNIYYVGFAGVSGFLVSALALFITFALSTSVVNKVRLESVTQQKVLGYLNALEGEDKDLRTIWNDNGSNQSYSIYKELLRSLRFEINEAMSPEANVLGITSLTHDEGKTFLAGSLSYAFAMMGKNVLLICEKDGNILDMLTNKKNAGNIPSNQKFESFLVKKQILVEDRITILNRNTSGGSSLMELRDADSLIKGFEVLRETFDIVIIDIDSSQDMHSVKEWMMFCDRSVAVYASGNKFKEENKPFIEFLSSQPGFLGWVLNKVKTG